MRYEGPIYRPPSEADSLLIQITAGCPHNRCTFCMVYKKGPRYRVRPAEEVIEDLREAKTRYGDRVRTIFFPAGNTIAAPTDILTAVFESARVIFPKTKRLTVYGSSKYILEKGEADLRRLAEAGLSRIHVGFESGHDSVLAEIKKGASRKEQIRAGQMLTASGIENSSYVILGIGGRGLSREHAMATASALNDIAPDYVRIRTFVPKVDTPLLRKVKNGQFLMATPHEVIRETKMLIEHLDVSTSLRSDHYTNYVNLSGEIPSDRQRLIREAESALGRDENDFRPFFIGNQ